MKTLVTYRMLYGSDVLKRPKLIDLMDELNRSDAMSRRITLALSFCCAGSLGYASAGDYTSEEQSIRHLLQRGWQAASRDVPSESDIHQLKRSDMLPLKRKVPNRFDLPQSQPNGISTDKPVGSSQSGNLHLVPSQSDTVKRRNSESLTPGGGQSDATGERSLADLLWSVRASDSSLRSTQDKLRFSDSDEVRTPDYFVAPSRQPLPTSTSPAAVIEKSESKEGAERPVTQLDASPPTLGNRTGIVPPSRTDSSRPKPTAADEIPSRTSVPSAQIDRFQEPNRAESLAQKIRGSIDHQASRLQTPSIEQPSPIVILKPPTALINVSDDTDRDAATHDAAPRTSPLPDRQSSRIESEMVEDSVVVRSPNMIPKSQVNLFADPTQEAQPFDHSALLPNQVGLSLPGMNASPEQSIDTSSENTDFLMPIDPRMSGLPSPVDSAATAAEAEHPSVIDAAHSFKPTLPSVTMHRKRLLELSQLSLAKSQESLKRGATHTARKHALAALQSVVAMTDAEFGGNTHSQQLASAFAAIRESEDFCGQFGVIDSRVLQRMVAVHETLALKQRDLNVVTALEATEAYLDLAHNQLVSAVGEVPEGSRALVMLGQIEFQLAKPSDTHATSVAVTIQQAAVETNPNDAVAYRVLGNSLFHLGLLEEASNCLTKSLKLQPNRLAYECLLEIARQLGDIDTARACLSAIQDPRMDSDDLVRNLSPQDFAATYRPVSRSIQSKPSNKVQASSPAKAASDTRISFGSLIPFLRR